MARASSSEQASQSPGLGKPATGGVAARAPTIVDVARRAGVSKSVVSRVMRGSGLVSERRSSAVLAAAQELGYRPNAVARSLVQGRSFNIGVLVSNLHNAYYAEVLDGIIAAAEARGYHILIATGHRDPAAETTALERLVQLRMDGLILAGPAVPAEAIRAASRSVPSTLVTSAIRLPGVDSISTNDVLGAELAVEHLAGLGHRRIAFVDGGRASRSPERRTGYLTAMQRLGLADTVQIVAGDVTEEGGYRGARSLLASDPRPTAIFAANDLSALGALNALDEAGLRVPDDVSLVGYDNTSLAALRHISLTTVDQPRREIGEQAVALLLARMERSGARARRLLLQPRLVVRSTTAPPAAP